ncbi:beta-ketoacyl-ACP synthase II [Haloplasma contractile]|uniref:3-oxoacyl-[acyl-carrier-protein] synthase 2 n=1 Tax=Haloplasma contractile SSD-17B TaxID=1033810 RepID=U2FES4_9MOLU|nr:beta-ketoacyl-ACP synthase II [Haloplasma contractile]ERJ11445.1 3-oxoacyl-acyl-carrier-protein synthase 2 [Haloplasma contractile SSD-17B]
MKRRVVITGLGAVSPIGNTVSEMWEAAKKGTNGIDEITLFDTTDSKVKIAAEIKDLDFSQYLSKKEIRRLDRVILLGMIAAEQAYRDANLKDIELDTNRIGVNVSSGIGGLTTIEEESGKLYNKGMDRISPFFIPNAIVNLIPGNIAIKYGFNGPCLPVVSACAAGTNAIGEAFRAIRDGYSDMMFTGGAEASITKLGIGGFASMKALNTSNDVNNASIPFDKRRSGFVMGEGSAVLVLEEYEQAKKRGAKIYGEVVGYGATCDAHHMTAPDPNATGPINCMKQAIGDANIDPTDVGYINTHGTSTPLNDKTETMAIKQVYNNNTTNLNISSTKSMTGHLLGASGAVEAIFAIKALEDGFIPPTINYKEKDEECDLNVTPNTGVEKEIKYAMSNSLGFGGHNASVVFKKYE